MRDCSRSGDTPPRPSGYSRDRCSRRFLLESRARCRSRRSNTQLRSPYLFYAESLRAFLFRRRSNAALTQLTSREPSSLLLPRCWSSLAARLHAASLSVHGDPCTRSSEVFCHPLNPCYISSRCFSFDASLVSFTRGTPVSVSVTAAVVFCTPTLLLSFLLYFWSFFFWTEFSAFRL